MLSLSAIKSLPQDMTVEQLGVMLEEQKKSRAQAKYDRNRDAQLIRLQQYRDTHHDELLRKQREYREANREKLAQKNREYRARKKSQETKTQAE